jgi:hypothetical protein
VKKYADSRIFSLTVSYTITELHPMLKVKEGASGTGGLCGSTFLNRHFRDFLTSKLGAEPGWDDEILAEAVERFDTVVRSPLNQKPHHLKFKNRSRNNIIRQRPGKMVIPSLFLDWQIILNLESAAEDIPSSLPK